MVTQIKLGVMFCSGAFLALAALSSVQGQSNGQIPKNIYCDGNPSFVDCDGLAEMMCGMVTKQAMSYTGYFDCAPMPGSCYPTGLYAKCQLTWNCYWSMGLKKCTATNEITTQKGTYGK